MADHWLKQAQAFRYRVAARTQAAPLPETPVGDSGDSGDSGDDEPNGHNGDSPNGHDILHLGELVSVIRDRLDVDPSLSDEQIVNSLIEISARSDMRARWLTAFNSPLGRWLVLRGSDLNTSLNTVLMLLPSARD